MYGVLDLLFIFVSNLNQNFPPLCESIYENAKQFY
jgi:hypothetical protein